MERLDRFMGRANALYYATHNPFGDFTTSPEISQVFGEILGLWAAVTWDLLGRPNPVLLVEVGPGRGTLLADALRAVRAVAPAFHAALHLHLIETSPRLRAAQTRLLPGAVWHDAFDTLPELPFVLLANEFLDALPIRQFVQRGEHLFERFIAEGKFVEHRTISSPALNSLSRQAGEGREGGAEIIFELNEAALAVARLLGERLVARPGAALFLDYGPERSTPGDSLQALRNGRPADALGNPGDADLTAHVDFAAFAAAARQAGAATYGPVPQGLFLARLGLFQRTERLARGQSPAKAAEMIEAARRLAEPHRMGRLFKALALTTPASPTPPGFETCS